MSEDKLGRNRLFRCFYLCGCFTKRLMCMSYQDPSHLHALLSMLSRHGMVLLEGPAGSCTCGQGAAPVSLASSLSLMRCISFLQAELFV